MGECKLSHRTFKVQSWIPTTPISPNALTWVGFETIRAEHSSWDFFALATSHLMPDSLTLILPTTLYLAHPLPLRANSSLLKMLISLDTHSRGLKECVIFLPSESSLVLVRGFADFVWNKRSSSVENQARLAQT